MATKLNFLDKNVREVNVSQKVESTSGEIKRSERIVPVKTVAAKVSED